MLPYETKRKRSQIANDTVYGLAGYVAVGHLEQRPPGRRAVRTGKVHINGAPDDLAAPFGGYKQSGNGREWGEYGLEEYLEVKAVAGLSGGVIRRTITSAGAGFFLSAFLCFEGDERIPGVVPVKARTHNHRCQLLRETLSCQLLMVRRRVSFRRDDTEVFLAQRSERRNLSPQRALRIHIQRVDRLARGHEQAVALEAAETEVGAALGQGDAADQARRRV